MPTYKRVKLKILKYLKVDLADGRKNNSNLLILQLFPITIGVV